MRLYRSSLFAALTVILAAPAVSLADTIEDVEKKIVAAYEKLTSYTAKIQSSQHMDMGDGNFSKSEFAGTTEWMRTGDKVLLRAEMKGVTESKFGDQQMKMTTTALSVCDGEYVYTLSETEGNKNAMKMKYDPAMTGDIPAMFKTWRDSAELTLLPDEKVDGRDTYVIQSKAKSAGGPTDKSTFYMDKATGLMLKTVIFGADGKEIGSSRLTDLKIGADLKADRFKFEAPAGVEVMDMSNMPRPEEHP